MRLGVLSCAARLTYVILWMLILAVARDVEKLNSCKARVDGLVVNLEPIAKRDGSASFHVMHDGWEIWYNPCFPYNMPRNPHSGLGDQCLYVAMCKSWHTAFGERLYTMGIQSRATFTWPNAQEITYWLLAEHGQKVSYEETGDARSDEEDDEDESSGDSEDDSSHSSSEEGDGLGVGNANSAESAKTANESATSVEVRTTVSADTRVKKSSKPLARLRVKNVIESARNAFRKQKPYAVAVMQFEGIKSLRMQLASIILVCDVARVAAKDAIFDIIATPLNTPNTKSSTMLPTSRQFAASFQFDLIHQFICQCYHVTRYLSCLHFNTLSVNSESRSRALS